MPVIKEVLVQTVRQWKSGADRGDVNALIARLDAALAPIAAQAPARPSRRP